MLFIQVVILCYLQWLQLLSFTTVIRNCPFIYIDIITAVYSYNQHRLDKKKHSLAPSFTSFCCFSLKSFYVFSSPLSLPTSSPFSSSSTSSSFPSHFLVFQKIPCYFNEFRKNICYWPVQKNLFKGPLIFQYLFKARS